MSRASAYHRQRQVDATELALVSALLRDVLPGRILDLGCGSGKLAPFLRTKSTCVIEADAAREPLARMAPADSTISRLLCDGRRLPFAQRTFSLIVVVRMIHLLADPEPVLTECLRVLRPGGALLVSYSPRPSLKTLEFGIVTRVQRTHAWKPITLVPRSAGLAKLPGPSGSSVTRPGCRRQVIRSGFTVLEEMGCGFDDLPLFHFLAGKFLRSASFVFRTVPWWPTWFLLASKPGESSTPEGRRVQDGSVPRARG